MVILVQRRIFPQFHNRVGACGDRQAASGERGRRSLGRWRARMDSRQLMFRRRQSLIAEQSAVFFG